MYPGCQDNLYYKEKLYIMSWESQIQSGAGYADSDFLKHVRTWPEGDSQVGKSLYSQIKAKTKAATVHAGTNTVPEVKNVHETNRKDDRFTVF